MGRRFEELHFQVKLHGFTYLLHLVSVLTPGQVLLRTHLPVDLPLRCGETGKDQPGREEETQRVSSGIKERL